MREGRRAFGVFVRRVARVGMRVWEGAYTKEEVLWMLVVEKERRMRWYGGRRWNWSKRLVLWAVLVYLV